ncbi:MAG TPA: hypothetical protein VLV31_09800 [Candidatus Acidoferrales bacterium]|nr:hypothetical protein [Candidatus Acidoferrales bacterium]
MVGVTIAVGIHLSEGLQGAVELRQEAYQLSYTALANPERFDQTLLDCVKDGMVAILGSEVLESLFLSLETYQGLSRYEIPSNIDTFFAALEKAFGSASGKTVGRFIIKLLYARLGLQFDGKTNRLLADYVIDARRELQSRETHA